jgi:TonB family protein
MTHRTRRLLSLNLFALLLLHAGALAPRLHASPPAQAGPDPSARLGAVRKEWLLYALRAREADEAALVRLVQRRGVDSSPTAEDEKELRAAGATDRLIEAVRENVATPPPAPPRVSVGPGRGRGIGPGDPNGVVRPGNGRPEIDYTRPFHPNDVTRSAVITHKPEPDYSEKARRNRVEGFVVLRLVLGLSGEVTVFSVVKGLPDGLNEKAMAAARQIKFTPAEKDGRKVSQYAVLLYAFHLPMDATEVDERAIILERPEPEYTEEARRNNVRGKVVLKVTLTSYGSVYVDSVEARLPDGLTRKAIEAAQGIRFEPARRGRQHVSQRATLEYPFAP